LTIGVTQLAILPSCKIQNKMIAPFSARKNAVFLVAAELIHAAPSL
jgi:hypothetical protein